jgi:hypothetical protein
MEELGRGQPLLPDAAPNIHSSANYCPWIHAEFPLSTSGHVSNLTPVSVVPQRVNL